LVNTAEGGGTTAAEVEQLEKIAGAQDQPKPLTNAPSLAVLSDHYTETFALIKPDAMYPALIERILDQIRLNRFHVMKKKKIWMSPALVEEFYQEHKEKPFFKSLVTYFTSYILFNIGVLVLLWFLQKMMLFPVGERSLARQTLKKQKRRHLKGILYIT
jgi:hypothetical protein